MEKRIKCLIAIFSFCLLTFGSIGLTKGQAQENKTLSDDKIICHCTMFGSCKASGSGSNCAQSQSGGNIQCSEYDGNC